jgi:hypothetical protein
LWPKSKWLNVAVDHRQFGYNTKLPKKNTLGRSCAFTRGALLRAQVGSELANYIESYVAGGMAVESLWVAVFLSVSLYRFFFAPAGVRSAAISFSKLQLRQSFFLMV